MYIIHYIDHISRGNLLSDYVCLLADGQNHRAETKIITRKDTFQTILGQRKPDIVHIHSCWDYKASQLANYAHKQRIAVVFSPHWKLGRMYRTTEHCISNTLRTMCYQHRMTSNADALLVSTEKERNELLLLGWKKRIGISKNCLLCNKISAEEMSLSILTFYQKVIDTRYRLGISNQEIENICNLLSISLSDDTLPICLSREQISTLHQLTDAQWQKILLYADDEDIRSFIDDGARKIELEIPRIDSKAISRFSPIHPKQSGALEKKEWLDNSIFSKQWPEEHEEKSDTVLHEITTMLSNSRSLIKEGKFTVRHLCELYMAIKYQDYDEDQLKNILKEVRLYRFSRRIIQILAELLHLEEGFMPFPPLRDTGTQTLTKSIV